MVEVKRKSQKKIEEEVYEQEERGTLLSLTGTTMDIVGKIALAAGTTALLIYLFTAFQAFVGLGVVASACIAVGGGAISLLLGNKLSSGFWIQGLVTA